MTMTDDEWNELNAIIAKTGVHYAPFMRCDYCGEMTDRNKMNWVRVRTYDGRGASEKWCNICSE